MTQFRGRITFPSCAKYQKKKNMYTFIIPEHLLTILLTHRHEQTCTGAAEILVEVAATKEPISTIMGKPPMGQHSSQPQKLILKGYHSSA